MSQVGFDRRIPLEWMNLAAHLAREYPSSGEAAQRLRDALHDHGDRQMTKAARNDLTVLRHIWLSEAAASRSLRDDALHHLSYLTGTDRLWVHWGMALAAYPFFRDVAQAVGRLLALQDAFSLESVIRRETDRHGDRSTVRRATQRTVRSMVSWNALGDGLKRGTYSKAEPLAQPSGEVAVWLIRAVLASPEVSSLPVANLGSMPELFPFRVRVSALELTRGSHLEVHRQGLDTDMVELRR